MTDKEKAQEGLRLLKDAVFNTVEKFSCIKNANVAEKLGIESSDRNGGQKNWLSRALLWELEKEGKIEQPVFRGGYKVKA